MQKKDYFYIGGLVLLVFLLLLKHKAPNTSLESIKAQNIALQHSISAKQDTIAQLSAFQLYLRDSISSLYLKYNKNQVKYVPIYTEWKKNDSVVASFDVQQLQQFFSARYK